MTITLKKNKAPVCFSLGINCARRNCTDTLLNYYRCSQDRIHYISPTRIASTRDVRRHGVPRGGKRLRPDAAPSRESRQRYHRGTTASFEQHPGVRSCVAVEHGRRTPLCNLFFVLDGTDDIFLSLSLSRLFFDTAASLWDLRTSKTPSNSSTWRFSSTFRT